VKNLGPTNQQWNRLALPYPWLVLVSLVWAAPSFGITRGYNDDSTPEAAVVVQVNNPNGSCTGTLISPTAVLTAKHCVTGDNFTNQNWFGGNGGKPAAAPPFTILVGNPIGNGVAAVGTHASVGQSVYGDYGPVNDQEHGRDVAIIWLNPATALGYATATFKYARIVRPDLASPVPSGGDDSEGGDYSVPVGISGWSPVSGHDPANRQVGYYGSIYHYPGYPGGGPGTPSGQYWVHAEAGLQIEPGDSGGPLFWQKPNATRQVIGVAGGSLQIPFAIDGFDCTFNACDIWTDVTRGAIADWVRNQMEDRSRSVAWLTAHGRNFLLGW
jgi:Trypsin